MVQEVILWCEGNVNVVLSLCFVCMQSSATSLLANWLFISWHLEDGYKYSQFFFFILQTTHTFDSGRRQGQTAATPRGAQAQSTSVLHLMTMGSLILSHFLRRGNK